MSTIKSLRAIEINDSRGKATLEAECVLNSGHKGIASVPSGASVGVHEAAALPASVAINNVNGEIAEAVLNQDLDQDTLDARLVSLDGTSNKSRLGANATLATSLAFARAVASERELELYEHLGQLSGTEEFKLPEPMFNIINGGKHSESGLNVQEFGIVPVGFNTFEEKVDAGKKIIESLKNILESRGESTELGDEGGFAPKLGSNEEALELIMQAITDAGYTREEVKIGLDAAASSFFSEGKYKLRINGEERELTNTELIDWYEALLERFPIIFIEDGLSEDDWEGFAELNARLGNTLTLVGDDLLTTNIERIKLAEEKQAVNSVLIKPNQIGTLTETIEAVHLAKSLGWSAFASHRSGETLDTFISDLAVGTGCKFIKAGSPTRPERLVKYERLIEIEKKLLN